MSADSVSKYVLKPASFAAVSGAAAMAWRPGAQVIMGDKKVPLALVCAGASFVASEVSELINDYLFDHIPQVRVLSHPMHSALNIGAQVGVVSGIESFLSPGLVGDQGVAEIAAYCALSEITATYLTDQFLRPWYETMSGTHSS
jgi:hypothetical protein